MSADERGTTPRIIAGVDALEHLREAVDTLGGGPVVLIVDEAVHRFGYAQRVADQLGGLDTVVHVVAPGEPTIDSVDAAANAVRAHVDAVVIGIGGGSALDTAKQAAVVAAGDSGVEQYLLCATPLPGRRPIIAIPTTSGTGAEVTRTCIVSDHDGRKMWTWGDEMLPDVVVLDPHATVTMPSSITASTGLDACVHALEAVSGQRRGGFSPGSATEALQIIRRELPRVLVSPEDLQARLAMQRGAMLAGLAIDQCGTGMAHALGHALGTLHHVPHGVAVTIGLDAAIEFNVDGAADAYVDGAAALECAVEDIPATLRSLFDAAGLHRVVAGLTDIDIDPDAMVATMAAAENQPMVLNNARAADVVQQRELALRTAASWRHWRSVGMNA